MFSLPSLKSSKTLMELCVINLVDEVERGREGGREEGRERGREDVREGRREGRRVGGRM